jgi:hypothetical protein
VITQRKPRASADHRLAVGAGGSWRELVGVRRTPPGSHVTAAYSKTIDSRFGIADVEECIADGDIRIDSYLDRHAMFVPWSVKCVKRI